MFITADNMKVLGTTHNTLNMIGYSYTAAFLRDESGSKHVSIFFFLIRIKRKRFFFNDLQSCVQSGFICKTFTEYVVCFPYNIPLW